MAINESRELEIVVSKIQKQLAPDAQVLHDVRLPGRHSKRDRQVDVLVRKKIGQYEMLIVLDCKDYSKPVDVKGVEEFYGLLQDVGGTKGLWFVREGSVRQQKSVRRDCRLIFIAPWIPILISGRCT